MYARRSPSFHSINSRWRRYAYFKKLDHFSTECIYLPDAYHGHAGAFLKDFEAGRPCAIIDTIHSGEERDPRYAEGAGCVPCRRKNL
jgi:hypothetical protein